MIRPNWFVRTPSNLSKRRSETADATLRDFETGSGTHAGTRSDLCAS